MPFPEILKSGRISVPCAPPDDFNNRYISIYKIYLKCMELFGDALKIANDRFEIPCGPMCLEGCFEAFLIKVVCETSCGADGSADANISISLLTPLAKPNTHQIICRNPILSYPDSSRLMIAIEEQYAAACGQDPAESSIIVPI